MATPRVSIRLVADLLVQLSSGTCPGQVDAGASWCPRLTTASQSGDQEVGQKLATVTSPDAPVTLGWAPDLLAKGLYFRGLGEREPWILSLTYATTGAVDIPVQGMLLLEAQPGDEITALAVQGSGEFEWTAWG